MGKKFTQAGKYSRQFTWLVRSYSTDPASGAAIPAWAGAQTLWGSLDESGGSYQDQFGTTRNRTNATITLRQFPTVQQGIGCKTFFFNTSTSSTASRLIGFKTKPQSTATAWKAITCKLVHR